MPKRARTARSLVARMSSGASASRAKALRWFFKTGPGQYGEGDRFLGLTMPRLRAILKDFPDLSLPEVEKLLESEWHEVRLAGVILLANRFDKAGAAEQRDIYRLYLRRTDRINNWDLVDASAPQVVGGYLASRSRAPLRRLARSRSVWERRIAIVATYYFIKRGGFDDTLDLALLLIHDRHDLIHKAVGWMLREVGKRDEKVLTRFLDKRAGSLPRTTLRYAIERLSPARRERYMCAPRIAIRV